MGRMVRPFRLYKSSNADLATEVFFICFILLTSFGLMCKPQRLQRNRSWFKACQRTFALATGSMCYEIRNVVVGIIVENTLAAAQARFD